MSTAKKIEDSQLRLDLGSPEWIAREVEDCAVKTFNTMLQMHVTAGAPKREMKNPVPGDVSGIINASHEDKSISMIVSFPKETILFMMNKLMRGESFPEVDRRVLDAVGEFTNIIYGSLKSSLSRQGYSLTMAIPHVVIGQQHMIWGHKCDSVLMLPMQADKQPFSIVLAIHDYKEVKKER